MDSLSTDPTSSGNCLRSPFCCLDHAIANASLMERVTGVTVWHHSATLTTSVNADEPRALDYNDYNQPGLYSPDAYRSSDHDPVIVGLNLREWQKVHLPLVVSE